MTAITVTIVAYVSIAEIVPCSPNASWKIFWIAEFQARAATRPNAAVINAESFSITSDFILGLCGMNFYIFVIDED